MKTPEPYNTGKKTYLGILSLLLPQYNEKQKPMRDLIRAREKARQPAKINQAISSRKLS